MTEVIEVEVASGNVFKIRKPTGALGIIYMGILANMTEESQRNIGHVSDPDMNEDPAVIEHITQQNALNEVQVLQHGFVVFAEKILPHIIVEGPKYEDIDGPDQYGLFLAILSQSKHGTQPFRILTGAAKTKPGSDGEGATPEAKQPT